MQIVIPTTVCVHSNNSCFTVCSILWNALSEQDVVLQDLPMFKQRVKSFNVYNSLCGVPNLVELGLVDNTL